MLTTENLVPDLSLNTSKDQDQELTFLSNQVDSLKEVIADYEKQEEVTKSQIIVGISLPYFNFNRSTQKKIPIVAERSDPKARGQRAPRDPQFGVSFLSWVLENRIERSVNIFVFL